MLQMPSYFPASCCLLPSTDTERSTICRDFAGKILPSSSSRSHWPPLPLPPSPVPSSPAGPPLLDPGALTSDQLECLCLALENCANHRGMDILLTRAEASAPLLSADHQKVLHRAKAWLLVQQRRFTDFKEHIQDNQFATKDHGFLQSLWNEAHYMEVEQQRAKRLDPVARYRVRKKNAYPENIWDGEGTSYCFKKSSRDILIREYEKQQMPDQQRKAELARETGLREIQVSNWFKNQRQRARQQQKKKRQSGSQQRSPSIQSSVNGQQNQSDVECSSDGAESEEQAMTLRGGTRTTMPMPVPMMPRGGHGQGQGQFMLNFVH